MGVFLHYAIDISLGVLATMGVAELVMFVVLGRIGDSTEDV